METPIVRHIPAEAVTRSTRARVVSLLGPTTVAAGLIWGILQPWRVTLLHPRGQGFWWLVIEPPVLVAVAGVIFAVVVARPLLTDLEAHDAAPR
ncbi:MAG TPA: hypothetical protein VNH45_13645 [Gaiellaceae bacterium]|jgi:hypothetical protein|nr:hypothetical protein [Gaiellaceae bacterium]